MALVLVLLLAGCEAAGHCDASALAAPPQSAGVSTTVIPRDDRDPLMRVADDTRAHGDTATAIGIYRRLHEMRPNDPVPLARLGSALSQVQEHGEAAQAYRAALALSPDDPDLHRGLAVSLLSLGQPEGAITDLEAAIARRSNDPRLFSALGVAHDLIGRHDLAQDDYQNGLRLAPQSAGLRNNYALSLALSGDYGAAATILGEMAGDPKVPRRYHLNLALVYGLAGNAEKATSVARTALDEEAVRNNLAYYAMLRALDDKARVAAIMGGQLGSGLGESLPP
ncbi:MAG TPA: tetratricopeptide repeat protein [Stellaceae bacterium]